MKSRSINRVILIERRVFRYFQEWRVVGPRVENKVVSIGNAGRRMRIFFIFIFFFSFI